MREKMRERRAHIAASKLDRVIPAIGRSPVRPSAGKRSDPLRSEPVYPAPTTSTPRDTGAENTVIPLAVRPPVIHAGVAARRHLLNDNKRLRDEGLPDAEAQARLTQQRAEHQKQTQTEQHERAIRSLAPQFMHEARRRLSQGGSYREEDVMPTAMQLAERSLHTAQLPRQADPAPKLLTTPYRQERGQQAQPITWGRVNAPAGTPRTELSADVQRQIAALVGEWRRR